MSANVKYIASETKRSRSYLFAVRKFAIFGLMRKSSLENFIMFFKKDKFLSAQLFSEIKETLENSKQLLANVEAYCGLVEEVSFRRSFS
jgi:hypothetical protein